MSIAELMKQWRKPRAYTVRRRDKVMNQFNEDTKKASHNNYQMSNEAKQHESRIQIVESDQSNASAESDRLHLERARVLSPVEDLQQLESDHSEQRRRQEDGDDDFEELSSMTQVSERADCRPPCSSHISFGEALAASDVTPSCMNHISNIATLAKRIESAGARIKHWLCIAA
jgi:hypothetical protein